MLNTHKKSTYLTVRIFSLSLFLIIIGCITSTSPIGSSPRLRIENIGSQGIINLSVYFPNDEVIFGSVHTGAKTKYKSVPNGIYRYAAYRFEYKEQMMIQRVHDWCGESPMVGSFTYKLDFDSSRTGEFKIKLIEITKD